MAGPGSGRESVKGLSHGFAKGLQTLFVIQQHFPGQHSQLRVGIEVLDGWRPCAGDSVRIVVTKGDEWLLAGLTLRYGICGLIRAVTMLW
ncbi:hypothetical protein GCM10027577_31850 [Spirosoma fluminis]